MDFHSYFSYESAQNVATTCENMKKFIHWMCEKKLIINDGIINDTTDRSSKNTDMKMNYGIYQCYHLHKEW